MGRTLYQSGFALDKVTFDQVGHKTIYASIGNKYFFTK